MNSPAWNHQQAAFAAALLDPHNATPAFLQTRNGTDLDTRFDVYRNNVHASLIDALQAAFPVTCRLTGEDFFRALARDFLRRHLPQGAALHDYGAQLPDFIRGFLPAADLPWLGDVAALEHAWWQAYGAADAAALTVATLARIDIEQLLALRATLHPAVRLLESMHPVHSIWLAHQRLGEPASPEHWRAECVLITRPDAEVRTQALRPAEHRFITALAAGADFETAAQAALETDPAFDLGRTLLRVIEAGAVEELHP
jgi:hypothetical protein